MIAASGFAAGEQPHPDLAAMAVKQALANTGNDYAHSVILLLSGHFVRHAQASVTAASRAARCLQITGCTVPGVFTEHSWALDQPAAAALALCGPISIGQPRDDDVRLTFTLPAQTESAWIADGTKRFGTLATDGENSAAGQVWTHGKVATNGRAETALQGGQLRLAVSRGIKLLTPLLEVTDSDSFEVLQLDDQPALDSLLRQLDADTGSLDVLPQQRLFAALPETGIDAELAMSNGRFSLLPILRVNRNERSVTLAAPLPPRSQFCWAWRDPAFAEQDMMEAIDRLDAVEHVPPAFGLVFSCIGRGPYFYQGHDRDVSLLRGRFPGMPMLGAYCAGEIAPLGVTSNLISYSSVVAIASANV